MPGDKEKIILRHYTNEAGAKAIKESGVIKSSTDTGVHRDAVFGRGAYLTTLSPDTVTCCNWSFLHFVFTTLVM